MSILTEALTHSAQPAHAFPPDEPALALTQVLELVEDICETCELSAGDAERAIATQLQRVRARIDGARLTLRERAAAYNVSAFGRRFPASRLWVVQEQGEDVIYGVWQLGNDYRNQSVLYGAYPPHYLERVSTLFPDLLAEPGVTLHAFAGSLPADPSYVRIDLCRDDVRQPDVQGSVYDVARHFAARRPFRMCFADPPYSDQDAVFYGVPMVDRRRAMSALATVVEPGGFLVWLDTTWPMHRKTEWRTCGRITLFDVDEPDEAAEPELDWQKRGVISLIRSTNHRFRGISLFERRAL